jgi:hypothetical protein
MSAYFLFSQEIRPTIREESPSATFGEIAKVSLSSVHLKSFSKCVISKSVFSLQLISARFKLLDTDERARFDKLAAGDKERYQKAMRVYKGEESE